MTASRGGPQQLHDALLAAVPGAGVAAAEVTAALTRAVVLWAGSHGWQAQLEVPVSVPRPSRNGGLYAGYIDLVVHRPDRPLAIELDRSDKRWSLDKLLAMPDRGWDPIWVRWGRRPCQLPVPAPVVLLSIPVLYERGRRPGREVWRAPRPGVDTQYAARRIVDDDQD